MTGKARLLFSNEPGKILECVKFVYHDEDAAVKAARIRRKQSGHAISGYPCPFPNHKGKWHIGHSGKGKRSKRKQRRRRK